MENAAEALKIAFAVTLFVLALTLSISSFSQATRAVNAITTIRDRESEYTYVKPSPDLSRTVGIDAIVSTMYRMFSENIEIYFFESDGETPLKVCYRMKGGNIITDAYNQKIPTSHIDLSTISAGTSEVAIEYIDILLGGNSVLNNKSAEIQNKYNEVLIYTEGLYEKFKNTEFEERLGEYEPSTGVSNITKRVITYIKK